MLNEDIKTGTSDDSELSLCIMFCAVMQVDLIQYTIFFPPVF